MRTSTLLVVALGALALGAAVEARAQLYLLADPSNPDKVIEVADVSGIGALVAVGRWRDPASFPTRTGFRFQGGAGGATFLEL